MAEGDVQLVLFEHTDTYTGQIYKLGVSGRGTLVQGRDLQLSAIEINVKPVGEATSTTILLHDEQPLKVDIPSKLLKKLSEHRYRIRNVNELDDLTLEEWAALKDRVRRRLASPIEVNVQAVNAAGLFGVKAIGTADLTARFFLNPALVDGAVADTEWVLKAEGSADIEFGYHDAAGKGLELAGRILATIVLRKAAFMDWIAWDFGFDLPDLPGFDLKLPKIPFSVSWLTNNVLQLPTISLPFLDAPSLFSLALPPFVDKLEYKWAPAPKLEIELKDGKLALHTSSAGAGSFSINAQPWVDVTDVSLQFADAKFALTAQVDIKTPQIDIPEKTYSPPLLPFTIQLFGGTLTPTFSDIDIGGGQMLEKASLSFGFKCDEVIVAAKEDPAVLIAFEIEIDIGYDINTRKMKSDVKHLKIVEPYPIELVKRTGEALGELIRLIAAIPVPAIGSPKPEMDGFFALLDRIGQLLAAAGKWLAKQAGKAAELLAGLVEAVFDALMQLARKLAQLGGAIVSHIAIEARLDPKTYGLRQIVLMPVGEDASLSKQLTLSALGFDFKLDASLRPSLVVDLGPESWVGLVVQPEPGSEAVLGTDLWLDKETTPQQAMGTTGGDGAVEPEPKRLIELKAKPSTEADANRTQEIVVVAMQHGRPRFFQTFANGEEFKEIIDFRNGKFAAGLRETGRLQDAAVRFKLASGEETVYPAGAQPVIDISLEAPKLQQRLLSLLTSADSSAKGGGFMDKLKQKVEITETTYEAKDFSIVINLGVKVHIDKDFAPTTTLAVAASLRDLSMKITGGEKIYIESEDGKPIVTYNPLGLDLTVSPKEEGQTKPYKQFYIDLAHGAESLGLADQAKAVLAYGKVSTSGKGLQFEVPTFRVGRAGFDLEAKILPEPVKLGGVDVPFRFTSGQVGIKGSKFNGGSLTGSGQLPQALVGEANATIALQLGAGGDGSVIVKGATARLDKSGDPIRCSSTRFDLTITELGFDFVNAGSYHFYFLLTGSAVFRPGSSEYATGLLKNFKDITIKLDKAPLAADARVLMSAISFQVKVDPPKKMSFFNIFDFELRGFGFHPAAPKFDGAPAMSISGQVKFTEGADKISPSFEFHSLWIAGPKKGSSKPQVRFDGLTVGLKTGAVNVEATAIAVDGAMPDLYDPGVLPKDVTAEGFLASGKLDIEGWASMSGAMGFLELRDKKQPSADPRYSFFLYGQAEKLAEPIDTPVGRIYLREFGFGFGHRYTLAGIAQAETATSPQQLVKVLDEVSRYQGSLNTFKAWQPTFDNDDLTLALRGMFALSAATERTAEYKPKEEASLPNPLLFDIVAAFRTDFTFLINLRAWLSVNYHDWVSSGLNESWKSNPTMRGYLYFSVPRKEFLGRFISDGTGHVGEHPKLPEPLVKAIKATRFSSTLYIRPGLFHAEVGWPYELGFTLGSPNDKFYLDLKGGLIHRIEDFAVLNGIAFKAQGSVYLEGRVGGSSLGAAAVARANFAIEARVLSYLSLKDFGDSFYYGYMRIDVSVGVSVEVWLSFKVFGHRISLSASFSLHLAVSIALEAVIGPQLLGGRADVSIGVRAFGRSLSVRIALSFNNDQLAAARAKVARFMEMGLAAQVPDKAQDGQRVEKNPKPEPPRGEVAARGDTIIEHEIGAEPLPPEAEEIVVEGRPIGPTDFWAMLFPTRVPKLDPPLAAAHEDDREWFVMQLLPRDHTSIGSEPVLGTPEKIARDAARATFFASPMAPLDKDFATPGHGIAFGDSIRPVEGAYLGRILKDGELSRITIAPGDPDILGINLDAVVADQDGKTLRLGKLLQSLFAGEHDDGEKNYGGKLQEPSMRNVDSSLIEIDADAKIAASQLEKAGRSRSNLTAENQREAEIEDTRSAVLSAVTETAGTLAVSGGNDQGKWPDRSPQIDARDFGLTFLVNRSALKVLFPDLNGDTSQPPQAQFTIRKSDVADTGGYNPNGIVALFNPPSRMFRAAQPKFTPTYTIDAQGIKLNWDLEPAWGASQGAYDDPEFHLKHYRIRRIVRGIPGHEYRADFLVKAGSAIRYDVANEGGTNTTMVSFLRPDFQFIDNLRKEEDGTASSTVEEIPDWLRKLLLGEATADDWHDDERPVKAKDVGSINLHYEIVPVDNAGTSDFGEPCLVEGFSLIETLPISPREVTLQISYAGMPSHVAAPKDIALRATPKPALRLLLKPGIEFHKTGENPVWPDDATYLLRIAQQPIAPSGGYGSDAVDEAKRRPDQNAIDRLDTSMIEQFILRMKEVKHTDPYTLVAEYLESGKDEPTLKYYTVTTHNVPKYEGELGPAHTVSGKPSLDRLSAALGAANIPSQERLGRRVFLASITADPTKVVVNPAKKGEWKTVGFNIAIQKTPARVIDTTAMSSVVETLEQPVHYEFKALERSDMRVESGRLIIIHPAVKSKLGDISYESVRDVTRRTATRLEWNANPASLQLTNLNSPVDNRTIGGFDVFCVDPDALPGRNPELAREVEACARPMGRVALLPAEMEGLDPSGFGDFGRIESAYPSDTLRLRNPGEAASTSGLRKAGWYSAAETTAVFPKPAIRRSIMPDPDEGLIAALFAGGKPDAIRVSIPAWRPEPGEDKKAPLAGWEIRIDETGGWGDYTDTDPRPTETLDIWAIVYSLPHGFSVPALRQLLQSLWLRPVNDQAHASEQDLLRGRLNQADFLPSIGLRIEALRRDRKGQSLVVASQEYSYDPMPVLHPILADALAFIQYAGQQQHDPSQDDLKKTGGKIYRRYAVAPDASPKITAKDFLGYLDEVPPERDPYAWGALRALGLATGFQLYDTDTGDYVRFGGGGLAMRVQLAFERALARYSDGGARDNGQPFFDLLTQPWGNVKLAWFDGGDGEFSESDIGRVEQETLAVAQIALRPRPDRLLPAGAKEHDEKLAAKNRAVTYFALLAESDKPISNDSWRLTQQPGTFENMRYDVLTVARTVVSQTPTRLTPDAPMVDFYEPRPAIGARDGKARVIAIIREIRISNDQPSSRLLQITAPDGSMAAETPWDEIVQPAVLAAVETEGGDGEEFCFGKFERLSADDWGSALFRRVGTGSEVAVNEALDRLAHYAGRRFSPLVFPVAGGEGTGEEQAARQRSEIANRITSFWGRFLEHCAPAWGKAARGKAQSSNETPPEPLSIFLSLGTVADPGQWRRAPSDTGTVSVTMVDADRRGVRRKFAVRPYGRYEAWSRAAPEKLDAASKRFVAVIPVGLAGALDSVGDADIGHTYFVDATLPRTEPLEKPVILSSVTHQPVGNALGRMELVVAHNSDMVLAQANRRNAALLAPLDISVGFWREFAHMPWLTTLEKRYGLTLQPMDQLGSLEGPVDVDKLTITREVAEQRLANLRQRVPDAWLGSTMVSAMNLPYFFRVHALVHATAGVVVSEQVATTFEEGFFKLAWPYETEGYKYREQSGNHRYSVSRRPTNPDPGKRDGEVTIVTFDLAAVRFIDCMEVADAETWFGKDKALWSDAFKAVAHLPEPGVSYRIVMEAPFTVISGGKESKEVLARSPEIEVLPNPPEKTIDEPLQLYLLQQSGARYTPDLAFDENGDGLPKPPAYAANPAPGKLGWRIAIPVRLVQEPPAFALPIDPGWITALEQALAKLPKPVAGTSPALAGLCTVDIEWHGPGTPALWAAAVAALEARMDCLEAVGALAAVAVNPPQTGRLKLLLPPEALNDTSVTDALKALTDAQPIFGKLDLLILRRPPTDEELAAFAGDGSAASDELRNKVHDVAETQLFGNGRRPGVVVSKGAKVLTGGAFDGRKET